MTLNNFNSCVDSENFRRLRTFVIKKQYFLFFENTKSLWYKICRCSVVILQQHFLERTNDYSTKNITRALRRFEPFLPCVSHRKWRRARSSPCKTTGSRCCGRGHRGNASSRELWVAVLLGTAQCGLGWFWKGPKPIHIAGKSSLEIQAHEAMVTGVWHQLWSEKHDITLVVCFWTQLMSYS